MSILKKILLFITLILIIFISLYYYNSIKYYQNEKITSNLTITFNELDPSISFIECFSLNYPVTNKSNIITSKSNSLTIKSGTNKNIICDAKYNNEIIPIFWNLPIKNIEGENLESRAFNSVESNLIINKLSYNKEKHMIFARILKSQPNKFNHWNLSGSFKFKQLPYINILENTNLCTLCKEGSKNGGSFFIQNLPINEELSYSTELISTWRNIEAFNICDKVFGITLDELNENKIPINTSNLLKHFNWDKNLIDGWKSPVAIALMPFLNCSYNNLLETWNCEKNPTNNQSKILLKKDDLCTKTTNKLVRESCQLNYFSQTIFPETKSCVNRILSSFGTSEDAIIKENHPSAKNLMFTQRALLLDENTLSFRTDGIFIHPFHIKGSIVPCKYLMEISNVVQKHLNNNLLMFTQKRTINLDNKNICSKKINEIYEFKTIVIGEYNEN